MSWRAVPATRLVHGTSPAGLWCRFFFVCVRTQAKHVSNSSRFTGLTGVLSRPTNLSEFMMESVYLRFPPPTWNSFSHYNTSIKYKGLFGYGLIVVTSSYRRCMLVGSIQLLFQTDLNRGANQIKKRTRLKNTEKIIK